MKIFQDSPVATLIASLAAGFGLYVGSEVLIQHYVRINDRAVADSLSWASLWASLIAGTYCAIKPATLDTLLPEEKLYAGVSIAVASIGVSFFRQLDNYREMTRHALGGFVIGSSITYFLPKLIIHKFYTNPRDVDALDVVNTAIHAGVLMGGTFLISKPSQVIKKAFGGLLIGIGVYYAVPQSIREVIRLKE